ncbi:MAG: hypothetical protein K6B70_06005 [Clostridia bacterium]|nr:hypothetical protein [Clostridia bacterium]
MSIWTKLFGKKTPSIEVIQQDSYETLRDKLQLQIADFKRNLLVPIFDPQKWTASDDKPIYTNCYAYALNTPIVDKEEVLFYPSAISNKEDIIQHWSGQDLVAAVLRDLKFLGISYRDDDGKTCENGEYRIAIYTAPSFHDCPFGFHFVRQDINGEWSEKTSWEGIVQKIGTKGNTPPSYDNGIRLVKVIIVKIT